MKTLVLMLLLFMTAPALAQEMDAPRPIAALDSVWLEELTWMEVRDAMKAGKTTVIVPTGGIEQNGPYLALGKHNYVLRATSEAIARKLGNALVAPIMELVPEGTIDPPSGHMRYPGTISLRQETFKQVLEDVCSSLKQHGFKNIVLIGDSGGNQSGMKETAASLNAKWSGSPTSVHFIPEYYNYQDVEKFLEGMGIHQKSEGIHDDYGITSIMMTVDPKTVRLEQRVAAGKATINGVSITPANKTIDVGKKVVEIRANVTVEAIKKATSKGKTSQQ